jgi:hypothetical protein
MYNDNFYKSFLNESINPFILFSNDGKLVDFNYEAEILFNSAMPKDIFELALSNSPHNFGFERKYLNLKFGKTKYYAIVVGYIDDENIGIELYKQVNLEKEVAKIDDSNIEPTNIFSLIEISKATNFDLEFTNITEIYDTSIPEIKLNINNFLLTLNEFFKLFVGFENIEVTVNLKVGEYEIINGKKHSIIYISCKGESEVAISSELESQALGSHMNIFKVDDYIKIEFPMIL